MTPRVARAGPKGLLAVEIRREQDVVLARQRARQIAQLLGFDTSEATRIATAVSEIARNAWKYAGGGRVEYHVDPGDPPSLAVRVVDRGKGIAELRDVLEGRYVSKTGMGLGIVGSRRLVDRFEIESGPAGTSVRMAKALPPAVRDRPPDLAALSAELARTRTGDPIDELTAQNQELLRALEELRARDRELVALNKELEDTNRGVVALYAELDEKADYLRRASELKSRFLSNMSHEFRTPLNTVISFSRMLLDGTDGPLNEEQRKQVGFARKAAEGMLELVNDLLDLAKVEAGKTVVRTAPFDAADLFGALRGMLRPLLVTSSVDLVFDEPAGLPTLDTDEGKVSQILRNFISNALKFTERGEVRVSARAVEDHVIFDVSDTGIGIAPEDQDVIFREYTQIDSHLQKRVKGTGLGLPLSRKLAELLGGRIALHSEVGVGSTFSLDIPVRYHGPSEVVAVPEVPRLWDPTRYPVLVLEDNPETVFIYEKYLKGSPFQVIPAATTAEARRIVREVRPVAAVVDIMLGHESAWSFISEVKSGAMTRGIPVYVVTMVDNRHKAKALGADDFAEKPVERRWLLERLHASVEGVPRERLLVVDDDPAARYLLSGALSETRYEMVEAADGDRALALLREIRPVAMVLDLEMPGLSGEEVLRRVREDPATAALPIVICSGRSLEAGARARLDGASGFVAKDAPRAATLRVLRETIGRAVARTASAPGGAA